MDGVIGHENEELRDRVSSLEKKVQQQDDEIVCLKSALSDAIRRLAALESAPNSARAANALPSRPAIKVAARTGTTPSTGKDSGQSSSPRPSVSNHQIPRQPSPSPGKGPTRSAFQSPAPMKKWPSTPSTASGEGQPTGTVGGSVDENRFPNTPSGRSNSVADGGAQKDLGGTDGVLFETPYARLKEPTFNPADGCLKFYLRGRPLNFFAPTSLVGSSDYQVNQPNQAPKEKLALDWVYGYRGRDARSNIFLLPTGEVVYFIAAVVVLYNVEEQMQRHYVGHTDDVKSMAIHPDKVTVATGQVAGHDKLEGRPHIRIWNSISLVTLKVIGIGDFFDRAVSCLAFSKMDGGAQLVAVDEGNEHVISVWDWQKGEKGQRLVETKSSTEPVLAVEYHPCEPNTVVSCGKGQICFWKIEEGSLSRKLGVFEKYDKPKYMTCLAFAENGDVISGDSSGNFFIWGRGTNKVSQAVTGAHEGGVFSICTLKDGSIVTGGKDRKVVRWDATYKKAGQEYEIPEAYGPVRMLSQGKGNMILVGTTKNSILHGSFDLGFNPIVQGHTDELWGLATHPQQNQFLTCGYDKMLYLWDTLTHGVIWCKEMPEGCHCVTFHPEGEVALVTSCSSRWFAVELSSRDVVHSNADASERIEIAEFSSDGSMLACGSRDNNIYIYSVSEGGRKFSKIGKCTGHSSFVTHLDWSRDGQFVQSNSGDYELLYWTVATCRQVTTASSMRDVEWATQNCTLGFSVCGIWPEGADGTDVNACCRSNNEHLVASADDFGKVNLFAYPCSRPKSAGHSYIGHSSHVTNVRFIYNDGRLISTGGKDSSILQWQVVESSGY